MRPTDVLNAIQNGTCDYMLDSLTNAIAIRHTVLEQEIDDEMKLERRGAMREAAHERTIERHLDRVGTRVAPPAPAGGFQPGDIVRIRRNSNLRPAYIIGKELVFVRARVSNGEVRYLVPDHTKYGSVSKFGCPMRELEFVRKGD